MEKLYHQFQRRNRADPNAEWHDVDYAKVHWALRACTQDPLGRMDAAISTGEIISTEYSDYRVVAREKP